MAGGGGGGGEEGDFGFQIAPMVDVVFVIMLFFMASAGAIVSETNLGLSLPSGGGAASGPSVPQVVDILSDGTVMFQDARVGTGQDRDLKQLQERLTGLIARHPDTPIIIRPADEVLQQRVIDVLNVAAKSKVRNLTFG